MSSEDLGKKPGDPDTAHWKQQDIVKNGDGMSPGEQQDLQHLPWFGRPGRRAAAGLGVPPDVAGHAGKTLSSQPFVESMDQAGNEV